MTTPTSSWQTVTSTWPTATSRSAQTPQVPTRAAARPSPAPPPPMTWTGSWRTEITSWWWGAPAWCCPWMTLSRPSQTSTTACGCEDLSPEDPDKPSDSNWPEPSSEPTSTWHSVLHCFSSRLAFLPLSPRFAPSSGKSLSLPHSCSAPFHTFLASAVIVI